MYIEEDAKNILLKSGGEGSLFGSDYYINMYRGCNHGCIYCDSRSSCYHVENFDTDVIIKKNAIDLLETQLAKKKEKGIIGISGSMSDCYGAVDRVYKLSRKALNVINKQYFGAMVHTKSTLVLRDLDLLTSINERAYANVLFTITTNNDKHSKIIEPHAPNSSERFEAINTLSQNGITTGIAIWPILPFITDNESNIIDLLHRAKNNGCEYALFGDGVTLRENQREYYYDALRKYNPDLVKRYVKTYKEAYFCLPAKHASLKALFYKTCKELGLKTETPYKNLNQVEQLRLF